MLEKLTQVEHRVFFNGVSSIFESIIFLLLQIVADHIADLQMIPPQMPRILGVLRQVPDLKVALCHSGSPWEQDAEGLEQWQAGLKQLAELPNVSCKVSGLGMFNPDWKPQDLEPIIHRVIDVFGPDRVMFGSNFPVDKLYNSYEMLWQTYESACALYSEEERQKMFYQTAADFYRI